LASMKVSWTAYQPVGNSVALTVGNLVYSTVDYAASMRVHWTAFQQVENSVALTAGSSVSSTVDYLDR
jgi:hypothetical protein